MSDSFFSQLDRRVAAVREKKVTRAYTLYSVWILGGSRVDLVFGPVDLEWILVDLGWILVDLGWILSGSWWILVDLRWILKGYCVYLG